MTNLKYMMIFIFLLTILSIIQFLLINLSFYMINSSLSILNLGGVLLIISSFITFVYSSLKLLNYLLTKN
jgi:hypothetical protein